MSRRKTIALRSGLDLHPALRAWEQVDAGERQVTSVDVLQAETESAVFRRANGNVSTCRQNR